MLLPDMMESVTYSKIDLLREHPGDESRDKAWNQFVINRCLMFGGDVSDIGHANTVNGLRLTNKMHSDYLRFALPSKKRFGKWTRHEESEDIQLLVSTYECSEAKAKQMLKVFTRGKLQELKDLRSLGGRVSKSKAKN